jgi:LacI family transcriptional regulator
VSSSGRSGPGQKQRPATINDVAHHAGVSIATVSRVLNGVATVDAALADRVRAACLDLQYRPNRAARALAGQRPATMGLLVGDLQNPFFMEIVRGVEDVAQRNGYLLVLGNSSEDPGKERQYIEVLCAEPVAGAIVAATRERQPALQLFRERDIPVVAVDRRVRDCSIDAVLIDNVGAAAEAVMHLITNGYRRIGLITGPETTTTGRERLLGYRQALQAAGIAPDPGLERQGQFTEDSGRRLADELLDLDHPVEALFTANNRLTKGALEALHARSLRVPDDVAVVGFDEVPWAVPGSLALTTVTQPAYELGSTAALRLIQRLQHRGPLVCQEIILAHQLCIRDSSRRRERPPVALTS